MYNCHSAYPLFIPKPPTMISRRRSLLAGTSALMVPLAGCLTDFFGNRPDLGLTLRNYTSDPQPLQVEILRDDGSDINEARVLRREFEVPPPTGDETAGAVRNDDIVPHGRYLVRVRLKFGGGEWDHHHFVPGRSGPAEIDIRVYRDEVTGELYTRFF